MRCGTHSRVALVADASLQFSTLLGRGNRFWFHAVGCTCTLGYARGNPDTGQLKQ